MWCDEARRIGGSAATVLHVQSTKPLFLVASLRGFAAASILNASRLFGWLNMFFRATSIHQIPRQGHQRGSNTFAVSALSSIMVSLQWSREVFSGQDRSKMQRWMFHLPTGHLRCARRILQKHWFSTSVSSNNLTMWSQGFKLSAPTIWIQIVNFG